MLSNTKKMLPVIAMAAAFTIGFRCEARAQHGQVVHHGSHGVVHGCYGGIHGGHDFPTQPSFHGPGHYQSHFSPQYQIPSFGWHQPQYHDTTHLDWHGPSLQRHGNHFHVQQGHYDIHRTGHWH